MLFICRILYIMCSKNNIICMGYLIYTLRCTELILHCIIYTVQFTLYNVLGTRYTCIYSVRCTVYVVHYIVYRSRSDHFAFNTNIIVLSRTTFYSQIYSYSNRSPTYSPFAKSAYSQHLSCILSLRILHDYLSIITSRYICTIYFIFHTYISRWVHVDR